MKKITITGINILAMILFVVAVSWAALTYLDEYTLHGKAITVPNVTGLNFDEAKTILEKNNLTCEIIDYKYKKGVEKDEILEQKPDKNSKVKKGRSIQLTLSSDKIPTQTIPDIIDNCSMREAEAKLKALGFKLTEPRIIGGEEDWVYGLMLNNDTLKVGKQIPIGSTLTLIIGSSADSLKSETTQEAVMEDSWFE